MALHAVSIIIIIIIIIIHTNVDANMEEGKEKEKRQYNEWPSGLYPVANRGLKGSWTDHSSTKGGINYMKDVLYNFHKVNTNHTSNGCP